MMRRLSVGCACLACVGWSVAVGDRPGPAADILPTRSVTIEKSKLPLSAALDRLQKQTGNRVVDRRSSRDDAVLNLDLAGAHFWPALEAIAREANARISSYQPDGSVALIEGPYRPLPTSDHGLFRTVVKRIVLNRDVETGKHSCATELEVAWEPWFQPFYLDVGPASVTYSPDARGKLLKTEMPGRGQLAVAGRGAADVEVRTAAPERSAARIDSLKGTFHVIGPTKMLTFTFDALKPIKSPARPLVKEQEGVTVSLAALKASASVWTFTITIDNPPGGPRFESYQSWLDNNQIYLEKGQGSKREVFLPASPNDIQVESVTASRAVVHYHFTSAKRRAPPGQVGDWRLVYRTPGRIVEVAVPYEFRDLELP